MSWSVTTVTFGRLVKSSTLITARPALLIDVRLAVVAALWFSQFTAPGKRGIRVSQVARREFVWHTVCGVVKSIRVVPASEEVLSRIVLDKLVLRESRNRNH